jgi:D-beta-D-heptose 7-phosphate kinase/D-beta-D-heptose 1-phosphate adenosyltransferase
VGIVGADQAASTLSNLLTEALGTTAPILLRDQTRPTTVKTRVIAGIQQVVRYDEESETPLSSVTLANYQTEIKKLLPHCGAVIVSDYGKGVISPALCQWLMARTNRLGIPVVVDPKGDDYQLYAQATLVTPNRQELALAVGKNIARAKEEVLVAAGEELMAKCTLKNLLITRSEDGMTLLSQMTSAQITSTQITPTKPSATVSPTPSHEPTTEQATLNQAPPSPIKVQHFPTKAREVFDVSGAGDTVVAAMGAALAAKLDLDAGAELATLAAAVVVGKVGTATASPPEIQAAATAAAEAVVI